MLTNLFFFNKLHFFNTKKIYIIIFSILIFINVNTVFSQILEPIKWEFELNQNDKKNAELIFKAIIEKKWHLYSQDIPEGGPIATSFNIEKSDHFELIGKSNAFSEPIEIFDETFNMTLKYFSDEAIFKQKIKILNSEPFVINGFLEFMCCDDEKCLPPKEVEFSFEINTEQINSININETTDKITETETETENKSLWIFFFISFSAGIMAIFTPCVYPMIPMTVSFFMQGTKNRAKGIIRGLIFGISIMFIYTSIGIIVSLTSAGVDFTRTLSTHWIPNIIFFILFTIFAASFFGMFEIVLPSNLANKADKQADKGGYLGAFFMGLTTVIVSFSCTGPFIGAILVEAASGLALKPTIGMLGFGLAFAMPFTLFAIFPSWLSGLPKSGGWLNSIKVVLGFIVLAFGLKFLANIDQTYQLNILSREIFLTIWIVIFSLLGLYLLGKIKFSHDSDLPYISVPRLLLVIITFTFVVYLIPGLFGTPLTSISPLIPPQKTNNSYFIFQENKENPNVLTNFNFDNKKIKYADKFSLPFGLKGFFDYEQGIEYAKKVNKPVMLDFKGHTCGNCKKMEAKVWSDPKVLKRLKDEFVIIAFYVDNKTKLPESEWITSSYDGKVKKTLGKKYTDFQISKFNANTQPYYVLIDHNGELLTNSKAYDLNINSFVEFLDKGIEEFNKQHK
ncbi:MAG: thioredoxin family protein [Bacteroidales bacterium]|nr:thioredoxin family protein [Bacteroidales bacterium]